MGAENIKDTIFCPQFKNPKIIHKGPLHRGKTM